MGRAGALSIAAFVLAACVPQKTAAPAPVPDSTVAAKPACKVASVIDGDTVGLSCDGGQVQTVRLIGLDAPEIDAAACPRERVAGERAREALVELVASGPVSAARFNGAENAGRPLVRLDIGGRNVATAMIDRGLAVQFDGVTYPDWCARP